MSVETCTVRFLLSAIDALEDAKDETGLGFVSDYCDVAIREVKKAIEVVMERDC